MPEAVIHYHVHRHSRAGWDLRLWLRWVPANAIGEAGGLGLVALVAVMLARTAERTTGPSAALLIASVTILAGAFEGVIVGVAQWLVLRRPLPELSRRAWVLATTGGALAAWALGMIPSTVISLQADAAATSPPEISDLLKYSLAAIMGVALGPILGIPQWLVLRRHLQRAGWWVLANAVAWAVGMPLVFVGAGSAPAGASGVEIAAIILATLACAGAVVGAIHGLALIWLLQSHQPGAASARVSSENSPTQSVLSRSSEGKALAISSGGELCSDNFETASKPE
ncbi:MAG TPA: hypothetical protein VFD58_23995 [Blastocatellia bacterium]|nr:hypothetical protein [Blastocatellia bacterium]